MTNANATAAPLRGDMSRREVVDTRDMEWTEAPGGQVWRKRLHRVGPAEAGEVTSLVRYVPGASFHPHPHPDGEEIFVIEGHFCDQQAVSGPGTFLLHPEGFEHAPWSEDGCLLLVKLRQYGGEGRTYVTRDTEAMDWADSDTPGVLVKPLYADARFPDETRLERWAAGAELPARVFPDGAELFVLEGGFGDEQGNYGLHTWLRLPPGAGHRPISPQGCLVYIKTGGVAQLRHDPGR